MCRSGGRSRPARALDLDHTRPEVGQLPCRERRRHRLLERHDGDPVERPPTISKPELERAERAVVGDELVTALAPTPAA